MKKIISLILALLLIAMFGVFALGSGEDDTKDQGKGNAESTSGADTNLGDYKVEILSCRLAKDYADKDIIIVKYKFTNNDENPASFAFAFDDNVYQNGVGLNASYVVSDSANYDAGNQTKEIKTGASLEVEVAYELNDNTTDIEVEVKELISLNDSVVKKTFSIS